MTDLSPGPVGRPWAVELLAPRPAAVPWGLAAEAAAAVGGSFALGVLTGHLGDGLLASLGALPAANVDRGGAYRLRLQRMVGAGLATFLGLLIGASVRDSGWDLVLVTTAVAAVAGLISSFDAVWSLFALNLLVYVVIAGLDPLPGPAWRTGLLALSGTALKVLVGLPGLTTRRAVPERAAVAAVFDSAAALLEGVDAPDRLELRRALTTALNASEDALVGYRRRFGGPDPAGVRLLLANEEALGLARLAVHRMGVATATDAGSVAAVRALAAAVRAGALPPSGAPTDGEIRERLEAARRALSGEAGVSAERWRQAGRDLWEARLQKAVAPRSLEATGRLVTCIFVAEVLSRYWVHARPYWVPLTVAVAIKPDFGSVFARAVQRAVGTAVGVVIGGTILVVVSQTRELLPAFVLLAALLPVTIVRNYGMFVTVLTPLVLIQLSSIVPSRGQLLTARLLDTCLGVGVVLVLGYAVWPSTWRPRLAADLQAAVHGAVRFAAVAATGGDGEAAARRSAYRALSDLRTTWSQHFADPSPTGRQARLLWPAVVALEGVVDEVVRLTAGPSVAREDLVALADAVEAAGCGAVPGGPAPSADCATVWDRIGEVGAAVERARRHPARRGRAGAGLFAVLPAPLRRLVARR